MKEFTIKEVEDYLTQRVSGITVINAGVEFPDRKEAFHVEGEKDYYVFANNDGTYEFTDGSKTDKITNHDEDGNVLSEEDFLDKVIKIIVEEE